MNTRQAAQFSGVKLASITQAIRRGKLRAKRVVCRCGRSMWSIARVDLLAWMRRGLTTCYHAADAKRRRG